MDRCFDTRNLRTTLLYAPAKGSRGAACRLGAGAADDDRYDGVIEPRGPCHSRRTMICVLLKWSIILADGGASEPVNNVVAGRRKTRRRCAVFADMRPKTAPSTTD